MSYNNFNYIIIRKGKSIITTNIKKLILFLSFKFKLKVKPNYINF